jgi:2-keto-4-pentenoate hydratase/2-oxohepta-3-ene-1,7-dioic acid hydratase in catechol pathway
VGPMCRLGALKEGSILDLVSAYALYLSEYEGCPAPLSLSEATLGCNLLDFIRRGDNAQSCANTTLAFVERHGRIDESLHGVRGERIWYKTDEVRILAPIPRPPSLRDFTAFAGQIEALAKMTRIASGSSDLVRRLRERPLYYKANAARVLGQGDVITWPAFGEKLDFEIELAAYIGKPGVDISAADAHEYVAGYTILNDVSLRDVQEEEMSLPFNLWGLAKSKDAPGYPMGPWMCTPDEINCATIEFVVRVNGEEWVRTPTSDRLWTFEEMIAAASMGEPLFPGDCIAGGAPPMGSGVDLGRWIGPDDVIECEIAEIGVLRNRVSQRGTASGSPSSIRA